MNTPTSHRELVSILRHDNIDGQTVAQWRDVFALGADRQHGWAAAAIDACNDHLLAAHVCLICGRKREDERITCANHPPRQREEWDDWDAGSLVEDLEDIAEAAETSPSERHTPDDR